MNFEVPPKTSHEKETNKLHFEVQEDKDVF